MPTIHEIDVWVAEYVLGHQIIRQKKGTIKERTRLGHVRPLRRYSKDISAAWEVAERLGVTLLPVKEGGWFALVGNNDGWESPAELFTYLQAGDFVRGGAAITKNPALSICLAGLRSIEKRESLAFEGLNSEAVMEEAALEGADATAAEAPSLDDSEDGSDDDESLETAPPPPSEPGHPANGNGKPASH